MAAIFGKKSHFVVTETIDRDLGVLGVIRYRKQHGQGCLQLAAIVGGHFGSKVTFCCNWQNEAGLRAIIWENLGCLRAIGGNFYTSDTDGVNLDMEKSWTDILDQSYNLLGGDKHREVCPWMTTIENQWLNPPQALIVDCTCSSIECVCFVEGAVTHQCV